MPRLTARLLLMPVATLVTVTTVLGLLLFGLLALPLIALLAAGIVGGAVLLARSASGLPAEPPGADPREP